MKFKLLLVAIFIIIAAIVGYNYLYQDHRDIASETPEHILTVQELTQMFSEDPDAATTNFLNKTIELSGVCTEVNDDSVTLDNAVYASTDDISDFLGVEGKNITIKARCIGYDDLLEEIKLDQASLVN